MKILFWILQLIGLFTMSIALMWFGQYLNYKAISDNHGNMPVLTFTLEQSVSVNDGFHTGYTLSSRDFLIDDIIPIPLPDGWSFDLGMMSFGDFFLSFGMVIYVTCPYIMFFILAYSYLKK